MKESDLIPKKRVVRSYKNRFIIMYKMYIWYFDLPKTNSYSFLKQEVRTGFWSFKVGKFETNL